MDYGFYVEYVHRGIYEHGEHTRYLCKKLQQVESGEIDRLMIFLPPRHSKSMTCTETFPSYFIGRNPDRRVIQTSYGDTLARKFGRANRQKIEGFGKAIFDISISHDTSAADNWGINEYRGGMISTGIGGAITGEGADLLIIDDPIKNKEEANSKTYRDKVWNEWQNTLRTRLHPGARVIVILTRWHEDDLAGRLLNPEYGEVEDWDIVRLPAVAEQDDLLGREEGESLWPEHGFDEKWAEKTEKAVGASTWASLYQQRPTPEKGSMVQKHWWQFYNTPYDPVTNRVGSFFLDELIQSWDLTFKNTEGTDMVVGQIWGRSGANFFLLDQFRARMDFPTTLQAFINLTNKWPMTNLKLVEDKANGPAIISMLSKTIGGIVPVTPVDSKESRMAAVSPYIESGNVYLPSLAVAPWIESYIDELTSFPKGANDDQCDATSQALNRLTKHTFSRKRDNAPPETREQERIHKHIEKMARQAKRRYDGKAGSTRKYATRY